MTISEMVKSMLAAGCSAQQIADAVCLIDSDRELRKRDGSAERMRRMRARRVTEVTRNSVTKRNGDALLRFVTQAPDKPLDDNDILGASVDTSDNVLFLIKKDNLEVKKERKKEKSTNSVRGTRLPADWELSPEDRGWAYSHGLYNADVDKEAGAFKDFWIAKAGPNGVKLNWQSTWRNWIRRHKSFKLPEPVVEITERDVERERRRAAQVNIPFYD